MDRKIFSYQGKACAEGAKIFARERCLDGILCLSAFHWWSHSCRFGINAKQPTYHYHCHDNRQSSEIHYPNRYFTICILTKNYPRHLAGIILSFLLTLFCPSILIEIWGVTFQIVVLHEKLHPVIFAASRFGITSLFSTRFILCSFFGSFYFL